MGSRSLQLSFVEGIILSDEEISGDIFATLQLGSHKVETTPMDIDDLKWQQNFKLPVEPSVTHFLVGVESTEEGLLGEAQVELRSALGETGGTKVSWHELCDGDGVPVAKVCLVVRLVRVGPGEGSGGSGASPVRVIGRSPSQSGRPIASPVSQPSASQRSSEPSGNGMAAGPSAMPRRPFRAGPTFDSTARSPNPGPSRSRRRRTASSVASRPESSAGSAASDKGSANSQGKRERSGGGGREKAPGGSGGQRLLAVASTALALVVGFMLVTTRRQRPAVHEVCYGDTVCSIAGCYGVSPDDVINANKVLAVDPDTIYPGDRLYIP